MNICHNSKHFLNVLLLLLTLVGVNTNAWGAYVNQQYTCTGYSYSIPSNTGYTWITLKGTSFNGTFSKDVSDNSSYNEKNSGWGSAPTTWDVTATMYAKAKDDYKFVGWYSNDSGSGTALSTSTSNNCYYSTTVQAVRGNSNPPRNFYAIFAKFKPSTTVIDFGDVAYNSAPQFKEFTIACHNVGDSWSQTGLSGVLSATISGNKTDNSEHTCTVRVTINPTAAGIYNQTLSITTPRGRTINVTVKAKVTAIPSYTWNSALDDLYVGQTINDVISFTSNGAKTYSILDWTPTGINNEGATTPTFVNNTLVCGHAGTLTLKVVQEAETNGFEAGESTKEITIKKYTPTFTWNSGNAVYYYQSEIPGIFSTTNTDFGYSVVSDNEASAKVVDNTLHIYNVEETANITVTQAENYKWKGKTETYVVNPVELNNHVPFTITSSNYFIPFKFGSEGSFSWNDGIKLGDGGGGLDWDDKYYDIRFTGIPDKLSFDYEKQASGATGVEWWVKESSDGSNWVDSKWGKQTSGSGTATNIQLLPSTRYLRFCYSGNFAGRFKNIHVTELQDFSATPVRVDFGTKGANYGTQEETVTFSHANAGRVTTMEIVGDDASYFSIERTNIPGTGRDLYATVTIAVSFDNRGEIRGEDSYDAVLHIEDNAGNFLNIPLTGVRNGKTDPEFSFNANHLPYFFGTNIANVASSTNTDYTHCPLTFETSDASIAQVIDGTLHIYSKNQEVTITVSQGENDDYAPGSATFTFTPRERPDLSVPLQLDKTIYQGGAVEAGRRCAWVSEDGAAAIRLGNTNVLTDDWVWYHSEKNFTISFDGTPGRLSFEYKNTGWVVTDDPDGHHMYEVQESSDGSIWNTIWSTESSTAEWTEVNELTINPSTRYLRFSFSGNYWGFFRNINISELVGYKYLRAEADGRYLSRGAKWGTQAIVDDFGMACRISNYTNDNTNFYTRFLFVDNQQYLYEADNHELYTDDGTAANNYNLWKQNVIDGTILTFQSGNEYAGDSHKGQYVTLNGNALALTSDASAATRWQMEDYTEHPAHILEILNREAAEAAAKDFGSDVNTLEKVRNRIDANDFEMTNVEIPALALGEQAGYYRDEAAGPRAIYDNEITNLVPGFYRLTVKGFSRISSANIAWTCHSAGEGMESVLAYIYANDVKYPIQSLYRSYQVSPLEASDELRGGYYYSTDLTSAGKAFDDAKRYLNDVYVYVEADAGKETGTLRYGIKNPSYVPGTWIAYENITLTRIARKEYIFEGTDEDEKEEWQINNNWNRNEQPNENHAVIIRSDVLIDEEVSVYSFAIENDAKVTIAPNGGLTIGAGGIRGATADNFKLAAGTSGETKGQTGYLRISPYSTEPMPEATVEMYSIGYYDKTSDEENIAAWQYVGTPIDFEGALAKTVFTRSWIYSYVEATDTWINNRKNLVMEPFVGYSTTQYDSPDGKLISYGGKLIQNNGTVTVDLAYTDSEHGENVVANSYTAPIDITNFEDGDFVNLEKVVYLFNTGSRKDAENLMKKDAAGTTNAPGQYLPIPIGTARAMKSSFGTITTIAPMQGFSVRANAEGAKLTFDYRKLVWNGTSANAPLRVTARNDEDAVRGALCVSIWSNGWTDNLYMIESEEYDASYENGYDATKQMSGAFNIFAVEDEDRLSVDATNSIAGTRVGVRTGEEMTYTMKFSHVNSENPLVLWDKEARFKMLISEEVEYTFNAEPNSEITERFQIIAADIPAVTTGVEDVESETKVTKFIKDNQLYILKDGVLYNASGAVVRK